MLTVVLEEMTERIEKVNEEEIRQLVVVVVEQVTLRQSCIGSRHVLSLLASFV